MRLLSKKPWIEMKYINKKQKAAQNQAQRQQSDSRQILFPRKNCYQKSLKKILCSPLMKHYKKREN